MSEQAENYFSRLDKAKSLAYHEQKLLESQIDVLILIVTVSRGEHNYLKQTVSMLDAQMKRHKVENMGMLVCNAETPASEHETAMEVRQYFPTQNLYNDSKAYSKEKKRVKEKMDYVGCINLALLALHASESSATHVLVLEDDMAAVDQVLVKINDLLQYKLLWRRDWALAKLFHPERYKGYSKSWTSVFEVASFSLFFGTLWTLLTLKAFPIKQRKCNGALTIWAFLLLNMAIIVLGIGRQHLWLEVRKAVLPYHFLDAPGDCTGAVLYPMDQLPNILAFLLTIQETDKYPLDIALADYLRLPATNLKGFLVEGDFFRHVGYYSSLHPGTKDAIDFFMP